MQRTASADRARFDRLGARLGARSAGRVRRRMAPIRVTTRGGDAAQTEADTRVVGVWDGEEAADEAARGLVASGEARTGVGRTAVTHEPVSGGGSRRLIVAGLGTREAWDAEKARAAAAAAATRAKEVGARGLS